MSESTWSAYVKVWGEWLRLVRESGAEDDRGELRLLVLYFVSRNMENGVGVSSIGKKLAALSFLFKLQGMEDWTKEFWVRQALKGYRKGHKKKDNRRPVTFANLLAICDQLGLVCSSSYECLLFTAAFSLAFFGVFRVGELVSPSKKEAGGILVQDVRACTGSVCLRLRRSKTDQLGKGIDVWLHALPGSPVCPVRTVGEFGKIRPVGEGPFLCHENGAYLSKFQFVAVFRKCLSMIGLDEKAYASHSFRIGAATEAARCGLDEAAMRRIGRWESKRFRSYIRPQLVVE